MRDTFEGPVLDAGLWVDHYLPHWTSPERSAARYDFIPGGRRLRIDHDQASPGSAGRLWRRSGRKVYSMSTCWDC